MAKPKFCPVPMRALSDDRLSASHWRILAVIGWHDGFGRNGRGCYASQRTLAAETNMHVVTLSNALSDLVAWGYLAVTPAEHDRRLRSYRVIYQDAENVSPQTNEPPAEVVSLPTKESAEIVSLKARDR